VPSAMMSYGSVLMTAAGGVLQAAPGGLPTPGNSTSVSELVGFTATENSRRFSVTSLLELEDLTAAGAKRGQDTDRSEGTYVPCCNASTWPAIRTVFLSHIGRVVDWL
jgi:hypothetical protein